MVSAGGDITTAKAAEVNISGSLALNSKNGSVDLAFDGSPTVAATTGKTGTLTLAVTGSPILGALTAPGGVNVSTTAAGDDITVSGVVAAASGVINLNAGGNIVAGSPTNMLTGQSVVFDSNRTYRFNRAVFAISQFVGEYRTDHSGQH